MTLKLPPTIDREAGPDKVSRVILWSRSDDFRATFDGFTTGADAGDFAEKLAPFLRPGDVRLTVETIESTTYRIED